MSCSLSLTLLFGNAQTETIANMKRAITTPKTDMVVYLVKVESNKFKAYHKNICKMRFKNCKLEILFLDDFAL
jgi:hypothetical protein